MKSYFNMNELDRDFERMFAEPTVDDRFDALFGEEAEPTPLEEDLAAVDEASDAQIADAQFDQKMADLDAQLDLIMNPPEEAKPEEIVQKGSMETLADLGMELATAVDRGAITLVDFFATPSRVLNEFIQGRDLPTVQEALKKGGLNVDPNQYMRDSAVADTVNMVGEFGIPVAAGFKNVQRASGDVGSVMADLVGLGQSVDDAAHLMRLQTQAALKGSDAMTLGPTRLGDDEDIYQAAYQSAKRDIIERNRLFANDHEAQMARVLKENKKRIDQAKKEGMEFPELVSEEGTPEGITQWSLNRVLQDLEEIYDINPNETLRVLKKKKGINFDPDEVTQFTSADKQFTQQARTHKPESSFMDWIVTPMSTVISKRVGPQVGGVWERAVETATRATDRMMYNIGKPIAKVIKYADDNEEFKSVLLDMHTNPTKKIKEARALIERDLGKKELKAFDNFLKETQKHQSRTRKSLYKPNSGFDDVYYFHTQKMSPETMQANQGRGWAGKLGSPASRKLKETAERTRAPTWEMAEGEIDNYANPLMTHLKYMADSEHLIQVAEKFRLRPSVGKKGKTGNVFDELARKLVRDGIDPKRAEEARRIMNDAYMGSTMAPHPGIRAVMDLAYGGTLTQFKSAMLNLHDIFVSMVNQGVRPTMKALVQSNQKVFGKALKEMGFDSANAQGEFVREFDTLTQPTMLSKIQEKTHLFARMGFKWSGFQAMDGIGKGVVIRSALNKARMAAKKGRLVEEWGEVLTKDELMLVRPFMQSEKAFTQMPKRVQQIVEEAVFTKLGQQQLISIAGRPLAYAQHPTARPLYAMSGFAIKQLAMLRKNVLHEAKHGSPKKAAQYMAAYMGFAGLGYGLIDETRSAIFKDDAFEPEDIMWGAVDQLAAAVTLNRLGDTFSLQKAADHPIEYLSQSVLPPFGITEAFAEDAVDLILRGEYNGELINKFPVLGDFYKYYWKDKKERPTKSEAYEQLFDDTFGSWGEGE